MKEFRIWGLGTTGNVEEEERLSDLSLCGTGRKDLLGSSTAGVGGSREVVSETWYFL